MASKETISRVPTNIITGFLGVGKTTAIRKLLTKKPREERWAVLVNEFGEIEDYKRSDLTLRNLIMRNVFKKNEQTHDWYAGMFLIVRGKCFKDLSGFDPQFFMYVEDCDFCTRARASGYKVEDIIQNRVVHHARRNSRRSVKYMLWHITSILKYWRKRYGW